jgi:hypothetical protein
MKMHSFWFKTREEAYAFFHAYIRHTVQFEPYQRREMGVYDGVHGFLYVNPHRGGFLACIGA